jgi:ABC-2 type transport system ATP-binding protein
VLELDGVVKHYGARRALGGVSLQARAGEIVGLLGPNGAGKSTLVSIVAGLLRPDSGRVVVAGHDVVREPIAAAHHVGIAPQEIGLYEVLTARENLSSFGALRGLRGRARLARIDTIAAALRLTHLLDRPVQTLSGGERRRVHTAIAFLHEPPLLLLDEPTVGADIDTRHALLEVVHAAADRGAAVVYSTHYLPEIEQLDAWVAILVGGELIATGTVDELVAHHAEAAVELRFAAPPNADVVVRLAALAGGAVVADDTVVRVPAPAPAALIPPIMRELGADADGLRAVTLQHADLDSVYLALRGAPHEENDALVAAP